jgi:hypothetical protein
MNRRECAMKCVVILLTFTCLGYLDNGGRSKAASQYPSTRPAPAPTVETYRAAWAEAKEKVDLDQIRGHVAELKSGDAAVRANAHSRLKAIVGVDCIGVSAPVFDAMDSADRRELAVRDWEAYLAALEDAVNGKIPGLLRESTHASNYDRMMNVAFIGVKAPHPAFVPLLRAMVANRDENEGVRVKAIIALCQIPHEGLIEYLLEQMDGDLDFHAQSFLKRLTRHPIMQRRGEDASEANQRIRQWWSEHKAEYKYDRPLALRIPKF